LGVKGLPQSASGQAAILTGLNIPAELGFHYGPKPNPDIIKFLKNGTLFHTLKKRGYQSALLNAYPEGYFNAIRSGRRLPGAIAMSALAAGIPLKTTIDLVNGTAVSADFTGQGWRDRLDLPDTPIISLYDAAERLVHLSKNSHFSFFEYWISDYAGHRADMEQAIQLVEGFDTLLGGLIAAWNPNDGLIFITSDHGNLEAVNSRKHTRNLVPGLIIGAPEHRESFQQALYDLTDITPAILQFFV